MCCFFSSVYYRPVPIQMLLTLVFGTYTLRSTKPDLIFCLKTSFYCPEWPRSVISRQSQPSGQNPIREPRNFFTKDFKRCSQKCRHTVHWCTVHKGRPHHLIHCALQQATQQCKEMNLTVPDIQIYVFTTLPYRTAYIFMESSPTAL